MGMCIYYRKFIWNFATIASPLTNLTRKSVPFVWSSAEQSAFAELKRLLVAAPCLGIFDYDLQTRLVCNASDSCIGSVLEQLQHDDYWHPVEFFSKRMDSA